MDRPDIQKTLVKLFSFVTLLLLLGYIDPSFAAESQKKESKAKRDKQPRAEVIVYYGHIAAKDNEKKFIYVEPIDRRLSRMVFYIDSKTSYVKDGFAAELSEIYIGEKVAVRYLLYGNLKIAEEVFVVDGDFQPDRYRKRDVKRRVRPDREKK